MKTILDQLCEACITTGVLALDDIESCVDEDLMEAGFIDSMGIVYLQEIVANRFGVELDQASFFSEANSLRALATLIEERR